MSAQLLFAHKCSSSNVFTKYSHFNKWLNLIDLHMYSHVLANTHKNTRKQSDSFTISSQRAVFTVLHTSSVNHSLPAAKETSQNTRISRPTKDSTVVRIIILRAKLDSSVGSIREGFFWFPSARPSILSGPKIATFFLDGRHLNSIFLSGRFCEQHSCTAKHVHSYGARLSDVYVFMCCAPISAST